MSLYTPLRLGVDLDGCVSQFVWAFSDLLIETSGRNLFGCVPEAVVAHQWDWANEYGYAKPENDAAWRAVKASPTFWQTIPAYPEAVEFLAWLASLPEAIEVYFITSRVGDTARAQTVRWLRAHGYTDPHVVMARGQKGYLTHGIGITHVIDDYPPNCISARDLGCPHIYLLDRPWNRNLRPQDARGITRIAALAQFRAEVDRALAVRGDAK